MREYARWISSEANGAVATTGTLQLDFPTNTFNTAPYLDSLNGIILGKDWNNQTQNFWNNIEGVQNGVLTPTP